MSMSENLTMLSLWFVVGLIYIPHCFEAQATMSLNLTAATTASLSGAVCPQATIRCVAENLPSLILLWFFNSVIVTQYTIPLVGMDEYPFRLDLYIPSQFANASGVIEVEAASQSEENPVHSNSVSTLRANLSMLREAGVTSISCGSANTRSKTYVLNFSITPPPGSFSTSPCLLQPESPETASLQWPPDVQNPVDVYRVHVSPAPDPTSSCPPEVGPGDSYHCSGLRIGVRYNITVNATNCNEQESITIFTVAPRVPSAPMDVTVTAIYNHQVMLKEVAVQWRSFPIVSERCAFPEETNHTVILQDSSGATADVISFTSDCCVRDVCSTFNCGSSFKQFSQIDGNYSVSITSKNAFGQSTADSVTGIAFSYQSLFNLTLTFENCQTSVICSSTSRAGSCSVGFSFISSNQELAAVAFNKSLNVRFDLLLDRSTEYYVQANVTVDGTAFQLRRNFSTGKFDPRLTTLNTVLTAAGIGSLFMTLVADLHLIMIVVRSEGAHCHIQMHLGFLIAVLMLLFAADIALWIAVWVYVGRQTDTCDLKWQSIRNGLILAAFVTALASLCGAIVILVMIKLARKCRSSNELENFTSDAHELENRCMDKAVYEDIPESTGYKNIFTTKTADEINLTANAAYQTIRTGSATCGDYYEN